MDRQAGRCLLAEIQEVVRVCTRVYALRKRIDGLQLTGGPIDDDLNRVTIALFNNVVTIGNRELIYTIASTPEFNVGCFEYAAQYEFLSKRTTLLESSTAAAVPSTSLDAAATATIGAEESDGVEFRPCDGEGAWKQVCQAKQASSRESRRE
jgi:hypothetical protein